MFDVPRSDLLNSTTGKFGRLEAVSILSRRIKRKILSLSVSLSRSTGVHYLFHSIMLNSPISPSFYAGYCNRKIFQKLPAMLIVGVIDMGFF